MSKFIFAGSSRIISFVINAAGFIPNGGDFIANVQFHLST
jgi:hypothetical protein